jgi:hypothetical protein
MIYVTSVAHMKCVTSKVFKFIRPSDDGRMHDRGTYLLDWEVIYRDNKGLISFTTSWTNSRKMFIPYIILHFVEYILLCILLMRLKKKIDKQNIKLVNDELYSTDIVNVLICFGLAIVFIIHYRLAHMYFTRGHP